MTDITGFKLKKLQIKRTLDTEIILEIFLKKAPFLITIIKGDELCFEQNIDGNDELWNGNIALPPEKGVFTLTVSCENEVVLREKIKIGFRIKDSLKPKKDFYNLSSKNQFFMENIVLAGLLRSNLHFDSWIDNEEYRVEVIKGRKKIFDKAYINDGDEDRKRISEKIMLPYVTKKITLRVLCGKVLVYSCLMNNSLLYEISSKISRGLKIIYKGFRFLWREHRFLVHPKMVAVYWKKFLKRIKEGNGLAELLNPFDPVEYRTWLLNNEIFNIDQKDLVYRPLISIVVPVFNVEEKYLRPCLNSVLNQSYQNWELCIADDCSTDPRVKEILKEYEGKDKRVKVVYREKNGHISAATNSALEISQGEYISLLDNDDVLAKDALSEIVKVLNEDQTLDFIYSDEDKLDLNGLRCDPYFKPDWSPDTFLSSNYICHFTTIRRSIVDAIGGFRLGYEGAQDYDLFLRVLEKTDKIYHISKFLYHWRKIPGSTSMENDNKNYAYGKGKMSLEDALQRRNIKGTIKTHKKVPYYSVQYGLEQKPLVSIIIPTKDHPKVLRNCLDSVYQRTMYKNYEIIIVDNGSVLQETKDLFKEFEDAHDNFKVLTLDCEFNYSYLNNEAVKIAKGEYILLLNNDTELISDDWLEWMLGYAQQKHIGIVGAKLYYEDKTIQHGGVVLGIGGIAAHAYADFSGDSNGWYGTLRVPTNYSSLTAACIMVSKEIYQEVSGLSEELKVAFNDVDFNLKVLEKGYYNVFLPEVELYHYESKSRGLDSTPEKYQRFLDESAYMYQKWSKELLKDKFYNANYSLKKTFYLDKKKDLRR